MTSSIGNINSFSTASIAAAGAGKLYVPVNKSALLYSHLDHVSGVAAGSGQSGVSISKLQILNNLIEHLSSIKNQPKESYTDLSNEQADVLIKAYQDQLQQALQTNSAVSAGVKPQSGELFTLLA